MAGIPAEFRDLFEKKAFAHLATIDLRANRRRRPGEVRVLYKVLPERVQGIAG